MSGLGEKTVLAIDPGRSKCGFALVRRVAEGRLQLLWRAVVPAEDIVEQAGNAWDQAAFSLVIVGSGTQSREVVSRIRSRFPAMAILVVDERDTTMQARERYWLHNPRRGWRRFLPATLQAPPEPVDDFVALILAERVLQAD